MSEQNYQTLIPFIDCFLYNIVDASPGKQQGFIDVTTRAAANDDFRKALIDIAQNSNDCSPARRLRVRCLIKVAEGYDDARKALNEIALDENDPLRDFAADALESLATQVTQATIDPSDGQSPPFDSRER